MYYRCIISEGLGVEPSLRAIYLCKALSRHAQVTIDFEIGPDFVPAAYGILDAQDIVFITQCHFEHEQMLHRLSSAKELLSLKSATLTASGKNLNREIIELAPYTDSLKQQVQTRNLYFTASKSHYFRPHALPFELVILDNACNVLSEYTAGYQQIFCFDGIGGASASSLPKVTWLPYASQKPIPEFFYPPGKPMLPDVVIIADRSPSWCLQLATAAASHAHKVFIFDPYGCQQLYRQAQLPDNVLLLPLKRSETYLDSVSPQSLCMVAKTQYCQDSQIMWELCSRGIWPLHGFLGPEWMQGNFVWQIDLVKKALTNYHERRFVCPHLPELLTFDNIAHLIHTHPAINSDTSVTHFSYHQHTLVVAKQSGALEKLAAQQNAATLFICFDFGPIDITKLDVLIDHYESICLDGSRNAVLIPLLLKRHPNKKWQCFDNLEKGLHRFLGMAQPTVMQVHILWLRPDPFVCPTATAMGQQAKPTLLLYSATGKPKEYLTTSTNVGSNLAAYNINLGLMQTGAFRTLWLPNFEPDMADGNIFLPPTERTMLPRDDMVNIPQLADLLEKNHIDVLLNPDLAINTLARARALFARKNVPVIGTLHAMSSYFITSHLISQMLTLPLQPFDGFVAPTAVAARTLERLVELYQRYCRDRFKTQPMFKPDIVQIAYGIDHSSYEGLHRLACRKALGIAADAQVVLSLGRLSQRDKADLLPLALCCKALLPRYPKLVLVIAGGEFQDYWQQMVTWRETLGLGEHLQVKVNVHPHDKRLYLGAADVFVSTSDCLQEAFGLSLIEAMSASLPVVASSWNGYREVVEHGRTGLLVETCADLVDPIAAALHASLSTTQQNQAGHRDHHESVAMDLPQLYAALDGLLGNPELRQRMGAAGRARALSQFDMHKQAASMANFVTNQCQKASQMPFEKAKPIFVDDWQTRHFPDFPSHFDMKRPLRLGAWLCGQPSSQTATLLYLYRHDVQARQSMQSILSKLAEQPCCAEKLQETLNLPWKNAQHMGARLLRAMKFGLIEWG